ncbi:MAG TPA: universal stress protein [Mycobacterium sp.]|uniref:universal stress protein n=1 Tax=Mycobacterium sp. TaxID=1785 RepID=UPI002D571B10|nr:universal stress protein [Mycobacterium sp.]HXY64514.1 universal stress protein [Mycobacterium sp.]
MPSRSAYAGIVVGIDDSTSSTLAVRWAARESVMRNLPLTVVHVSSPLAVYPPVPIPAGLHQRHEEDARKIVVDAIKAAEDSVGDGNRPEIDTRLLVAAPVPALIELSKEAHMMVVGCRGQDAVQRVLLGSVSTGLVHHAHCPVAVIHDETPTLLQPSQLPVLVGIDGSPASQLATAIAFDEASFRGVELVALHAYSDADVSFAPFMESRPAAEKTLSEGLAGFQEHYPDVPVCRRVVFDHPARRLLDESESAQLVVVGSHGRGGFGGMLLGSVSTAVVHAARIPVIVARQQ